MSKQVAKDTIIKKGKRFLKAINKDEEVMWTRNFRTALRMTQEEAKAFLKKYGKNGLADACAVKDVLQEFPFNAVIRVRYQDMVIYVQKMTKDKISFCHLVQNAYHYRDIDSAQRTLRKYLRIMEENGYFAEVVTH